MLITTTTPADSLDPALETPGLYGHYHRHLSNSGRNVAARRDYHPPPEVNQTCRLGSYILDVPLNNIDFDLNGDMIIFDWRPCLDNLFGVYTQSQEQARLERCIDLDANVIEQHLSQRLNGRASVHVRERRNWQRCYESAPLKYG
ncbi:hypothetical protein E8E11_000360 [Didymella keratinophila]|nr:hypothetical protein E8E11_000360 [Didymella keratinophila]